MSTMDGSITKLNSVAPVYGESQLTSPPVRQAPLPTVTQREAPARPDNADKADSPLDYRRIFAEPEEDVKERETDRVEESVNRTNQSLAMENRSMRFRINRDYGELQVQIVDSSNDKVIRSIPSDEMMRLASRMRELSGVGAMVDESR